MKEGINPFFSQENLLKNVSIIVRMLDFLGNQIPQISKGE